MMRDDIATCPACGRGLDASGRRLYCGACAGVLVTEDELRALISEMQAGKPVGSAGPRSLALEPADRAEARRTCPRCPARMAKHRLYGMLVDRCPAHGIWFDASELQDALARVGAEAARPPLRDKVLVTAAGVGWVAFLIASALVAGPR
jgi:Zn-finger nucleic acid-binding protein